MGGHYNDFGEWIDEPDYEAPAKPPPKPPFGSSGPGGIDLNTGLPVPTGDDALNKLWEDSGKDPAKFAAAFIAANGLQADQMNHAALQQLVDAGNIVQPGLWAMDQADEQGRLEGIVHNGTKMQLIGGNGWTPMAPWPADGGGGGGRNGLVDFHYPEFTPPSWDVPDYVAPSPFTYADYQPTTAENFQADPGYDFAKTEGLRGITNDAAAKGLRRTGGYEKAIGTYLTGVGAQEFGNVDARRKQDYTMQRGNQADIYDRGYRNNLTNWMTGYNAEAGEFNRAQQIYGTNFGTAATSAGINADALNSLFAHQLSLYDIATRDLPKYTPTTTQSSSYGY